jgi:hypothetical protein
MTTRAAGDRQLREMTKTSSVCSTLRVLTDERGICGLRNIIWKCSQYSSQIFDHAITFSTIGSKNVTLEHEETRMILAGGFVTFHRLVMA